MPDPTAPYDPATQPGPPPTAGDATTNSVPPAEPPAALEGIPERVGRYEIVGEIARGGMGAVYRARDPQFGRNVAVKLLHPAARANPAAARRFRDEARITGQLQHPGIPPAYEVGELSEIGPFMAMKLIKGDTLETLLRRRPDPGHDRGRFVAIFEKVCEAVGYAHAHGVIHRDLKPANVMVGAFGEVQVMDWGLAKVLASGTRPGTDVAQDDTSGTEVNSLRDTDDGTQAGSVLGTPAYMPPEQAIGAVDEVDRRSDVFGLGAILCQILTGLPPYTGASSDEIRKLAARAKLDDTMHRLAWCGADSALTALCERCLSVDQDHRPADAGAVAAAVEKLRADADERARKAEVDRAAAVVKADVERGRRRWQLAATAAVLVALAAGGGLAYRQWQRAEGALGLVTEEQGRTAAQLAKTQEAEAAAVAREHEERKAKEREKRARETAQAVTAYMQDVFAQVSADGQASPTRKFDPSLTVRAAMDHAAKTIGGRFKDRPELEAAVRDTVGNTYRQMALYSAAEEQLSRAHALLEKVLGPDDPDTLTSAGNLGVLFQEKGDYTAAEKLFKRVLAGNEKVRGPDHPNTLPSASNLAELYRRKGDFAAAEPLYKRALAGRERTLGPDHPDTLTSAGNLAALYHDKRNFAAAEPLYERVLAGREKALGPDHPDTLGTVGNLAVLYFDKRDYAAAEPLYKRALVGRERVLGPDHPDTLTSANNLAAHFRETGDLAAAEPLYKRALAGRERILGPDHPDTLTSAGNLAVLYREKRDYAAAEPLYKQALAGREKLFSPNHRSTLRTANGLALLYWSMHRYDESIPRFEDVVRRQRTALGDNDPETLSTLMNLGVAYKDAGRASEAVALLEQVYAARKYPQLSRAGPPLLDAYIKAGRVVDAARFARDLLADGRKTASSGSPQLGNLLASTGKSLLPLDPAAAEPVLRESMELREKLAPKSWSTASAKSLLGGALLGQRKYAAAEPFLLAGYAGLTADAAAILPSGKMDLPDTADRLIRLYLETDRPEEVKKWRAERAKYPRELAPRPRAAK